MKHWTSARRWSFGIHAAIVLIPLSFSTVSAVLFWQALFDPAWIAFPVVAVIDVLALLGLVLSIARVPSPFVPLRHALPFISVVPLGLELYWLLAHNGPWIAVPAALLLTGIMVAVAWRCYRTIEGLFIDPVDAARELARSKMAQTMIELEQVSELQAAVDDFVAQRLAYRATVIQTAPPAAPQLTDDGAEMLIVDGERISLRQLSRITGTPLTTLRRKLAQNGTEEVS